MPCLLAPSRDQVRDLNARARIIERAEGRIAKDEISIGDNAWAVGDLVMTRHNAYRLRDTAGRPVLNGDRWRVTRARQFGLRVQRAALKNECVHRTVFPTRNHARKAIARYIEVFYNRGRLHSGLDYKTPQEIHGEYMNRQQAA